MWQNTFFLTSFNIVFWVNNRKKKEIEMKKLQFIYCWNGQGILQASNAFSNRAFGSRTFVKAYWNITADMFAIQNENFNRLNQAIHHCKLFATCCETFSPLSILMWQRKVHFEWGTREVKKVFLQKRHIPSLSWVSVEHFISSLANVES